MPPGRDCWMSHRPRSTASGIARPGSDDAFLLSSGRAFPAPTMFTESVDLVDHLLALDLVLVVQALRRCLDVHVDAAVGIPLDLHFAQQVVGKVHDLLRRVGPRQGVLDEPGVAVRVARRGVLHDAGRGAAHAGRLRLVDGHAAPEPLADALGLDVPPELAAQSSDSIVSACEQERPLNWIISFTRSWRVLDDVAHGGGGVAQAHHRQLADSGADQAGGGRLDAG